MGIKLAEVFAVFTADTAKYDASLKGVEKSAKGAGDAAEKAFTHGFHRGLSQAGEATEELGTKLGRLTGIIRSPFAIGAGAVLSFGEVVRQSIKTTLEFGTALERAELAMHGTGIRAEDLKRGILGMNAQLGSARELAKAASVAVTEMSGISVKAAVGVTAVGAKFAALAETTPDRAVEFLADALDAFQLKAGDAADVAGKLIDVFRKGGGSFDEIQGQFRAIAPGAHQLGLSFDDVAATLKVLGDAGVPAHRGLAALGIIIPQVSQNLDAFREIGIDVKRQIAEGGLLGLVGALQEATRGQEERFGAFGIKGRAFGAASKLLAADLQVLRQALEEIGRAGSHSLDELHGERLKGASQAVRQLHQEWESFLVVLGEATVPPAVSILRDINALIKDAKEQWQGLSDAMERRFHVSPGQAANAVLGTPNQRGFAIEGAAIGAMGGAAVGGVGAIPGAAVGAITGATFGVLVDQLESRAAAEHKVVDAIDAHGTAETRRRAETILTATIDANAAKTAEARAAALKVLREAMEAVGGAERKRGVIGQLVGPERPERETPGGRAKFALSEMTNLAGAEERARAGERAVKVAEVGRAIEVSRLGVVQAEVEAARTLETERAQFDARQVQGTEGFLQVRRQLLEETLAAELRATKEATAGTIAAIDERIGALDTEIARRKALQGFDAPGGRLEEKREVIQFEDRIARLRQDRAQAELDQQQRATTARDTATKARIDLAKFEEQELRKLGAEEAKREDGLFQFRRQLGLASLREEMLRNAGIVGDTRRSVEDRRNAFAQYFTFVRGGLDRIFQAEVSLGQRSVREQIEREHAIAGDESRDLDDRLGGVERAFQLEMQLAQDAFDFRKSLNMATLRDEAQVQVGIARAAEQGSRTQIDALKKLADVVRQIRDEGRALGAGVLGVISDRLQRLGVDAKFATVSLKSVERDFAKQQERDAKVTDRFMKGGRVRLESLQGALGRVGTQEQVQQAGGPTALFRNAFTPLKDLFQKQLEGDVKPENAIQGNTVLSFRTALDDLRLSITEAATAIRVISLKDLTRPPGQQALPEHPGSTGDVPEMPGYATGTPFVKQTGPALLHEGERVFSAGDNRAFGTAVNMLAASAKGLHDLVVGFENVLGVFKKAMPNQPTPGQYSGIVNDAFDKLPLSKDQRTRMDQRFGKMTDKRAKGLIDGARSLVVTTQDLGIDPDMPAGMSSVRDLNRAALGAGQGRLSDDDIRALTRGEMQARKDKAEGITREQLGINRLEGMANLPSRAPGAAEPLLRQLREGELPPQVVTREQLGSRTLQGLLGLPRPGEGLHPGGGASIKEQLEFTRSRFGGGAPGIRQPGLIRPEDFPGLHLDKDREGLKNLPQRELERLGISPRSAAPQAQLEGFMAPDGAAAVGDAYGNVWDRMLAGVKTKRGQILEQIDGLNGEILERAGGLAEKVEEVLTRNVDDDLARGPAVQVS